MEDLKAGAHFTIEALSGVFGQCGLVWTRSATPYRMTVGRFAGWEEPSSSGGLPPSALHHTQALDNLSQAIALMLILNRGERLLNF